ncbi:hypothetical protein FJ970_02760 [Mesorhizobium sp. B2-1-8]|uniref:hypothetical protein n=1 Tax=Mesorhizobium sp. B2-1-8 TaxID=2589967 RepID=UPI00112CFEEB|nr:hypothetical protein [Mesorhizobium sp. B2-1-8]UCI19910.1 hypothetical protein FJ970_02760 [Mesorhizobium sp. B2-1-8]
MTNLLSELSESVRWRLMVDAAKKAAEAQGYSMARVPGRGLSNIWNITKDGKTTVAAIRTTRDRYIAFPPLKGGTKWKTLDDVETVIVATVDSKDDPENVEVYIFPADDVRKRFNAHYAARSKEGQAIKDNFGMWVGLDLDNRGIAASVGTGILDHYKRVAVYPISDLLADNPHEETSSEEPEHTPETVEPGFSTIAEVMAWARDRVAQLAGVQVEAVKLDLKIEY